MQVTIRDATQATAMLPRILETIIKGLEAGPVVLTFGREKRSNGQNAKMHAMVNDIAAQTDWNGKKYPLEWWKAVLVEQFQEEMRVSGTPLTHQGSVSASFDGLRVVQIRPTTTKMSKKELSQLVEYLYSVGVGLDVRWSEKAEEYYQEMSEWLSSETR